MTRRYQCVVTRNVDDLHDGGLGKQQMSEDTHGHGQRRWTWLSRGRKTVQDEVNCDVMSWNGYQVYQQNLVQHRNEPIVGLRFVHGGEPKWFQAS